MNWASQSHYLRAMFNYCLNSLLVKYTDMIKCGNIVLFLVGKLAWNWKQKQKSLLKNLEASVL